MRRLFVVEFDLAELSSHFFNQILRFKAAAEAAGLMPCILLRKDVEQSLAGPLEGHRVIEFNPAMVNPAASERDYPLDWLADGDRWLRSLWAEMERMAISRHDIVLITSGLPIVIYSLGAWLGRLDFETRPAVFFRFFDHSYIDANTMEFSKESWRVRFAAMDLSLRPGQERVFFTANNQKLAVALEQLCMRHVFQMPLPKYYGEASNMHSSSPGGPVIYAHMNARCGVMLEQIEPTIRAVLNRYPGARFLVKYCRNALQHGADATLSNGLIECGVELIPTEQSHAEHLHTIARSDVVFLPYEVTHYAGLASGVFAEGAALGKVLVYPGNSWMEQQVAGGHATGISFAVTNHSAISAAVLQALDMLPGLSKEAQERSHGFRAEHSCARNLTLMLSLADEKHDMRLTYTLGRPVAFKSPALSRGYMGRGWWSATEDDGVWSVGPFAELFFRIEPKPSGPLVARLRLTPYFAKEHPQRITISANGVEIGQWDFSDSEERQMTRLEFVIPSHLAAQDEINILFRIKNPISPHQIGASIDARALGIYLHEMIIEQATATNGESTTG